MKRMFLSLLCASLLLTSCDDYGESLKINEKSEVFYKGDGVKEADAKNLGDFLLKQGYFTTTDDRTVQLLKEGETYVVKFIVDEEKIRNQDSATVVTGFKVWHMWIQDNVFKGARTKLVLADAKLKDLREVGEFTAQERAEINSESENAGNAETPATDEATKITPAETGSKTDTTHK
jgi:hypothetical protein